MNDAIQYIARYYDARPYQSLKLYRIILEIPIEQGTDFVNKFGVPHAGDPKHVAITMVDIEQIKRNEAASQPALYAPSREAEEWSAGPTTEPPKPSTASRPNPESEVVPNTADERSKNRPNKSQPQSVAAPAAASKSLSQRAAMCCKDGLFQKFLQSRSGVPCGDEAAARQIIIYRCGVNSRSQIIANTPAGNEFRDILDDFHLWRLDPDLPPITWQDHQRERVS